MTEFSIHVEVRRRDSYLQLLEGRVWTFKDTVWESLLGVSPEGQRDPGKMDIPQEGYPKGAGADHFCVLQNEPLGKKTGLAEEGAFPETPGKKKKSKRFTTFGRRGTQLRKSRRILLGYAESKLDLNRATVVNVKIRCINVSPWDQSGFTQEY